MGRSDEQKHIFTFSPGSNNSARKHHYLTWEDQSGRPTCNLKQGANKARDPCTAETITMSRSLALLYASNATRHARAGGAL